MTPREFTLAKKAAASMLAAAMLAASAEQDKPKTPKPRKKRNTGYIKEIQAKFATANAAYESRKEAGATLVGIEREFGLKPNSLNNWRSRRLLSGDGQVRRTYRTPLKD
jgi:hypothetical protein